eukprot:6175777-Pleurochrysis_carterae.AAC.1
MHACIQCMRVRAHACRGSQDATRSVLAPGVADRMVSVRPCLKAAVEALSYVDAAWPCILWCASWNDICSMPVRERERERAHETHTGKWGRSEAVQAIGIRSFSVLEGSRVQHLRMGSGRGQGGLDNSSQT